MLKVEIASFYLFNIRMAAQGGIFSLCSPFLSGKISIIKHS